MITVPEKLILSSSRVMKDSKYGKMNNQFVFLIFFFFFQAKYFKSESKLLEIAQLPLIFYLLSERKKPKSFWKPYFGETSTKKKIQFFCCRCTTGLV